MFVNRVKILLFVSNFFIKSFGLEKLETKDNSIILVTESIIRNTTNNLFLGLQFNKQGNPKIKQALLVHNFFTSATLKDHNTLNLIVKISRVHKNNNETDRFITILNEILNEDWNEAETDLTKNEGIIRYVDEFLNNLNEFKESSGFNNDYEKLDIKDEIIHILKSDNPSQFNPSLKLNLTESKSEEDEGLSDNEFWTGAPQPTRRIYQGQRTKIKNFPFMASIQIFNNFQCAGSIIKSDLILTAASCLQLAWNNRFFRENPAFLSVIVGSTFYNGGGEQVPVLEVYFHPDYNPKNLRNNIAVLRLLRHLKFRKHKRRLKKIDIDWHDSSLPLTTEGITILGWGARGPSNIVRDPWSNQLAFAVLDIYHPQECQEIYSREYVTRTNFCAGFTSKGGGACNHDVGGPGVVNGILVGIISFGSPVCGTPDAPTVFTKVGYYAEWIEEIMEQDVPRSYKKTTLTYPTMFETTLPTRVKATTFKIVPIAKYKPIPFYEADALRLLEDEELFKEFLSTVFDSKEVNEYKNLLSDFPVKKTNEDQESIQILINNELRNPAKPKSASSKIKTPEIAKERLDTTAKAKLENIISHESELDNEKEIETDDTTESDSENNEKKIDYDHQRELITEKKIYTSIEPEKVNHSNKEKTTKHRNYKNTTNKYQNNKDTITEKHEQSNAEEADEVHELALDAGYHNMISIYDSEKQKQKRFTVFDANIGVKDEVYEKKLEKLIDNFDLNNKEITEKPEFSEGSEENVPKKEVKRGYLLKEHKKKVTREEAGITQLEMDTFTDSSITTRENSRKLRKDEVLTLLYLSDKDSGEALGQVGNDIGDFDDNLSEGIPISEDGFKDLTFRNNMSTKSKSLLDFISRSELYDVLSEAIDEVTNFTKT